MSECLADLTWAVYRFSIHTYVHTHARTNTHTKNNTHMSEWVAENILLRRPVRHRVEKKKKERERAIEIAALPQENIIIRKRKSSRNSYGGWSGDDGSLLDDWLLVGTAAVAARWPRCQREKAAAAEEKSPSRFFVILFLLHCPLSWNGSVILYFLLRRRLLLLLLLDLLSMSSSPCSKLCHRCKLLRNKQLPARWSMFKETVYKRAAARLII